MLKGKGIALCIVALLIALGAFAGCGTTEIVPTTPTNPAPSAERLIYTLGLWQASYDDTPYIESIMCDLDSDGQDEEIRLYTGPTSGVASYVVTVWKNKTLNYSKMFVSYHGGSISLGETADGAVEIKQTDAPNPDTGEKETTTLLLHFNQYGLLVLTDPSMNPTDELDWDIRTAYAHLDIDGDGQTEYCLIEPVDDTADSPFRIIVMDSPFNDQDIKYYGVYDYGTLSRVCFAVTNTDEVVICGIENGTSSTMAAIWDVRIENGQLALYDNGKLIEPNTSYPDTSDPLSYLYTFNDSGSVIADLDGDGSDEMLTLGHYRFGVSMSSKKFAYKWMLRTTDKDGTQYTEIDGHRSLLTLEKDELGRIIVKEYTERQTDEGTFASLEPIGEIKYMYGAYYIASL